MIYQPFKIWLIKLRNKSTNKIRAIAARINIRWRTVFLTNHLFQHKISKTQKNNFVKS